MTLNDVNKIYEWKENGRGEDGYYFILSDTVHHCDYNVTLMDSGEVTVNGAYVNNIPRGSMTNGVPREVIAAALPRVRYFAALHKLMAEKHGCGECK